MTLTAGPPTRVGVLDDVRRVTHPWQADRTRRLLMEAAGLRPEDETPENSRTSLDLAAMARDGLTRLRDQALQDGATLRQVRGVLRNALGQEPGVSLGDDCSTVRLAEMAAGVMRNRRDVARHQGDLLDRVRAKLLGAMPDVTRPIAPDAVAAVAATRIRDLDRKVRRMESSVAMSVVTAQVQRIKELEEQLQRRTVESYELRGQPGVAFRPHDRAALEELIEAAAATQPGVRLLRAIRNARALL